MWRREFVRDALRIAQVPDSLIHETALPSTISACLPSWEKLHTCVQLDCLMVAEGEPELQKSLSWAEERVPVKMARSLLWQTEGISSRNIPVKDSYRNCQRDVCPQRLSPSHTAWRVVRQCGRGHCQWGVCLTLVLAWLMSGGGGLCDENERHVTSRHVTFMCKMVTTTQLRPSSLLTSRGKLWLRWIEPGPLQKFQQNNRWRVLCARQRLFCCHSKQWPRLFIVNAMTTISQDDYFDPPKL